MQKTEKSIISYLESITKPYLIALLKVNKHKDEFIE